MKGGGDEIGSSDVLARLDDRFDLVAPALAPGRAVLERRLVREGAAVMRGEPLARIRVFDPVHPGLQEEALRLRMDPDPSVEAALIPMPKMRAMAICGGVAVAGFAVAALALAYYLAFGGVAATMVGILALCAVAAALRYGEFILKEADDRTSGTTGENRQRSH